MRDRIAVRVTLRSAVLAIALLSGTGIGGARLSGVPLVNAREFGPTTTPKAKYVAPLAAWPAPSYRAKDFAIIERGGLFHLFYTRVQRYVPSHAGSGAEEILNETALGHAVSPDLENWTELDTVLSVRPGAWDEHHVWAPSIIGDTSLTYLFYSGVRDSMTSASPPSWVPRFQEIGIAISSDPGLAIWSRPAAPAYQPCPDASHAGVPWATCQPYAFIGSADFRDPFLLEPDPNVPGSPYSMLFTARVRADQFNYVAGVAQSTSLHGVWNDAGALWETHFPPGNSKVESPHVLRRGADYHLFFSGDDNTNGILWMTSTGSLLGPWTQRGTLLALLGNKADGPYPFSLEVDHWYASEHFRRNYPSGPADYFCVVHAYDAPAAYGPPGVEPEGITIIEFRQMLWQPDGTLTLATPNPVRSLAWSLPNARAGNKLKLRLTVEGAAGRSADLEASIIRNGVETSIAPGLVGLPASLPLTGSLTELSWTAPSFGAWLPLDLRVRVKNQPLAASATVHMVSWQLGIGADAPTSAGEPSIVRSIRRDGTDDPNAATPVAPDPAADVTDARLELALHGLPSVARSGAGHGFALDLPGEGRARLEMFDTLGRRVRVVLDDVRSAGRSIAHWDGKDERGARVPRGIYFARLTSPFGERSLRVLHVDS